jgi:DNA-binding IscR family transcriptional regulator
VVRALEGPIALGDGKSEAGRGGDAHKVMENVFKDLSSRVEACFDSVTIADICARAENLGLRPRAERYTYVI